MLIANTTTKKGAREGYHQGECCVDTTEKNRKPLVKESAYLPKKARSKMIPNKKTIGEKNI